MLSSIELFQNENVKFIYIFQYFATLYLLIERTLEFRN